jgi:hypothetical protein
VFLRVYFTTSWGLAIIGAIISYFMWYVPNCKDVSLMLGFFVIMEILQALQYQVLDQCDNPWNNFLTFLTFLHVFFQPFIIHCMMLKYAPMSDKQKIIVEFVIKLSLICGILMTLRLCFEFFGVTRSKIYDLHMS